MTVIDISFFGPTQDLAGVCARLDRAAGGFDHQHAPRRAGRPVSIALQNYAGCAIRA